MVTSPNDRDSSGLAQRKLTSILAADVVGYSRMMGVDENGTHKLLIKCRQIIDRNIKHHGGRIFNTGGDSVMAEFSSTVEAVRCAIEIQEELVAYNADRPPSEQMWFRIGLNVGDVIIEGDDLIGDGVNVAARMESIAKPGGICISGSVYELVHNKLSFAFKSMGEQAVKNIIEPVSVYSLLPAATPKITSGMAGKLPGRFQKKRFVPLLIVITLLAVIYFIIRGWGEDISPVQQDTGPRPAPALEPAVPERPELSGPPTSAPKTELPSEKEVAETPELKKQSQVSSPELPLIQPSYFAGRVVEGMTRKTAERFVIEMTGRGSAIITIYRKDEPTEPRKTDSGRWWINQKDRVCFQFRKFAEGRKFCRIYAVEEGREFLVSGDPAKPKWALEPHKTTKE